VYAPGPMGSHPLNLLVRFALETCALLALGAFGWTRFEGALRWVAALALPIAFAVLWGSFAVPGDPSRGGSAPVPVPGAFRLVLELGLFGLAAWALHASGYHRPALAFAAVTLAHYALSWDRLAWLLRT
jgi:hypothetical protein